MSVEWLILLMMMWVGLFFVCVLMVVNDVFVVSLLNLNLCLFVGLLVVELEVICLLV